MQAQPPCIFATTLFAAAAEWIVNVETYALSCSETSSRPLARFYAEPNAGNVVPATVITSFDIRHADNSIRTTAHRGPH